MKIENINVRVSPADKALAEAAAKQDGRSMTNYVVSLIREDAARRAAEQGQGPRIARVFSALGKLEQRFRAEGKSNPQKLAVAAILDARQKGQKSVAGIRFAA